MTAAAQPTGTAAPRPAPVSPPHADTEVRSLDGLVTALKVLLTLCGLTAVASGLASYRRGGLIADVLAGGTVTDATLNSAGTLVFVAVAIDVVAVVGTGVVFMIWFWRLLENARFLDRDSAPAAGWAIGSWFIPVANFVLPGYYLARADRISGPRGPATPIIVGWALLFGVANVLSRVVWRGAGNDLETVADFQEFAAADRRDIWVQLLFVATAATAIAMVRAITGRQQRAIVSLRERQRAAAEARQATWQPPVPPFRPRDDQRADGRSASLVADAAPSTAPAAATPSAEPDPHPDVTAGQHEPR